MYLPTSPPSEGPWAQCHVKGSPFKTALWDLLGGDQISGWGAERAVCALWFHGFHKDSCPKMQEGVKSFHWNFIPITQVFIVCRVTLSFLNLFLSHTHKIYVIAWKRSYKSYFQTLMFLKPFDSFPLPRNSTKTLFYLFPNIQAFPWLSKSLFYFF